MNYPDYPTADPEWPYFYIWESIENAASVLAVTRAFLNTVGNPSQQVERIIFSNISDTIAYLNPIIGSLAKGEASEIDCQSMFPFLKIGERLINPALITAIDFQSIDDDENQCTEVGFGDSSAYFYGEEAEIIKRFFLSGSKAYDLNSLFG